MQYQNQKKKEKSLTPLMYTTCQKFGHTFSFNVFSLFSWLFTLYILTEGVKTMNEHIWNYVVDKKVWKNSKCFKF